MDRKRIGLLILGGYDWVGGLYYTLNLIKTLDSLPDAEKPVIIAFWGNDIAKKHLEELTYPYLDIQPYSKGKIEKYYAKGAQIVLGRDPRANRLISEFNLDSLYPYNYPVRVNSSKKVVAWFPDFQHKFLPALFPEKDIASRDQYLDKIQSRLDHIVFSSHTALGHYNQFYPNSKMTPYVIQFCSVIDFELPVKEDLEKKYGINQPYFICSNQFWKHKNHELVFRALKELKDQNSLNFKVFFTGKEEDPRNPDYFPKIKNYVEENGLTDYVVFLGFISREDQLGLMRDSLAVIQPSLFEGWGTVVEDAKTLGVQVLCSDIEIHHEQLGENAYYFDKDQESSLAEILKQYAQGDLKAKHKYVGVTERLLSSAEAILKALG